MHLKFLGTRGNIDARSELHQMHSSLLISYSTRAPAVGFRIRVGRSIAFYVPDVVYIPEREEALRDVRLYVGDGEEISNGVAAMPELPDVAAFKKYFDSTALHEQVARVRVLYESMLAGVSRRSLQTRLKHARLEGKTGATKSALKDLQAIAGIGNVYSDEVLFQAKVHPGTRVPYLDSDDFKRLHRSIKRVLKKAVEKIADPEQFPRSYIIPQRHEEGQCPRCGSGLATVKVSGRTEWIWPNCQKKK